MILFLEGKPASFAAVVEMLLALLPRGWGSIEIRTLRRGPDAYDVTVRRGERAWSGTVDADDADPSSVGEQVDSLCGRVAMEMGCPTPRE